MIKCIGCGKSVLFSTDFGNISLCKKCASQVNINAWKNRDVESIGELTANRSNAVELAKNNGLSIEVVSAIEKYFDVYINAGYITTINGKAGQKLKIFADYCIIDTQSEERKEELTSLFSFFAHDEEDDDEEDDDEEGRTIFEKEKDRIVKGLMTGKFVQTGIGLAASAVIDKQEKEKANERKAREIRKRRKKRDKIISVGEQKLYFKDFGHVDTYLIPNTSKGCIRFIPKGLSSNDYFACTYFFFNVANIFERKRIKTHMDAICDMLNEKIEAIEKEQEKTVLETRLEQEASIINTESSRDAFAEIRKYKELLDEGIITEDEFAELKKKLLGL